jgi:hypothetical protein
MRKLLILFVALISIVLGSCTGCNKKPEVIKPTVELVPENIISTNRETMFLKFDKNYRWYETYVVYKNFLDEETDGSIQEVTSVFQVVKEDESHDAYVVMFYNTEDSASMEVKSGYWLEDLEMNNEAIKLTFKEAFDRLMATDCIKPHSRNCVLRKEVGPKLANPQYIFGNTRAQVYVDAVTGNVTDKDPVFNGLNKPLGEWP